MVFFYSDLFFFLSVPVRCFSAAYADLGEWNISKPIKCNLPSLNHITLFLFFSPYSPFSYPAVNRYSSSSLSSQASNEVSNITGQSESSDEVFNMQVLLHSYHFIHSKPKQRLGVGNCMNMWKFSVSLPKDFRLNTFPIFVSLLTWFFLVPSHTLWLKLHPGKQIIKITPNKEPDSACFVLCKELFFGQFEKYPGMPSVSCTWQSWSYQKAEE